MYLFLVLYNISNTSLLFDLTKAKLNNTYHVVRHKYRDFTDKYVENGKYKYKYIEKKYEIAFSF